MGNGWLSNALAKNYSEDRWGLHRFGLLEPTCIVQTQKFQHLRKSFVNLQKKFFFFSAKGSLGSIRREEPEKHGFYNVIVGRYVMEEKRDKESISCERYKF